MIKHIYSIIVSISLVFILSKDSVSWPGIPYPFHGPEGETILWLGKIGNMAPTPDGQCLFVEGGNGKLQFIELLTGVVRSTDVLGNFNEACFTPDGLKMFISKGQREYFFYENQTFQIFDYFDGNIQPLYSFANVAVAPQPISPDYQKIVYRNESMKVFDIETGEEIQLPESAPLGAFYSSDGKQLIGIELGDDPNQTTWNRHCPYYLVFWDIETETPANKIELKDLQSVSEYRGLSKNISYLRPNNDGKTLIAIESVSQYPSSLSIYIHIIDMESGSTLNLYPLSLFPSSSFDVQFSPDMKWLAYFGDYEPNGLIDITQQTSASGVLQENLIQYGPYEGWECGGFNHDSTKFYYLRKHIEWRTKYALGVLDIEDNTKEERVLDRRFPPSIAAISGKTSDLIVDSDVYKTSLQRWNYRTISCTGELNTSDIPGSGFVSVRYCSDEKYIAIAKNNRTKILETSSWESLGTVTSASRDVRTYACFSNDVSLLLTASGNKNATGIDNLIRIWDAKTFGMLREIRGHSDSVWYAEFSPDDRQIVSASLDGTAKVWDVDSGAMVSEFVGHATGVEYAAFMPDGGRVMSVGRDRRAFLWNADNAEVERTFENIHLPAQLSPDGKLLFAGSEVWDVETGDRIKTLDGVAQDYSCLTLSPDGTMLLTSEYEGFTKVWNVQEHILKPSGVWDYSVHK